MRKYIDGDPVNGLNYDWKKVLKTYRGLKIPPEYDYSSILPLQNDAIKWHVLMSERSVGKTTNLLLLGMVLNKLYGTVIQLVRNSIDKASYYRNLFNTINQYNNGQYIKALTDGEYDTIYYYQRQYFFAGTDDKGRVTKADKPFCIALDATDCYALCSSYEQPLGDWIVLDECFNDRNTDEEFIRFCHLCKTILRERQSGKIFVLGNTIDIHNIWFRQLEISDSIKTLHKGDSKILYTPDNMPIFTAFLDNRAPARRKKFNKSYFGFDNPELNAITGNGEWVIKQYPAACMHYGRKLIDRIACINYNDDVQLGVDLITSEDGEYLLVHPVHRYTAEQAELCYVNYQPLSPNEVVFGYDKLSRLIMDCHNRMRILYSDNQTGDVFNRFIGVL